MAACYAAYMLLLPQICIHWTRLNLRLGVCGIKRPNVPPNDQLHTQILGVEED